MPELVYVDEQPAQANQVLRSAVASEQFAQGQVAPVMPASTIDETIELVLAHDCKVLVTDYRLSEHKADVQFTGADLVRAFQQRFDRFPCFVTTAFAGEAIDEKLDPNIIFPKSDFLDGERAGRPDYPSELPFFVRVRKKMAEYDAFVSDSKEEWNVLARKNEAEGLSAEETERLLELDDIVERLSGKDVAVEKHLKREALEPFSRIIESAEALVEQIERELDR